MIARKYGSSVADLTQANSISARKPLRIGQELMIPASGVAPVRTATPRTGPPVTSYTVVRGDTLTRIASQFGISVDQLKAWNNLKSTRLSVGQRLRVAEENGQIDASNNPPKIIHEVRRGETLNQIATTYKTTVDAILSWNNSDNLAVIHPGDQITIFPGENR
jgi:membrane-bound lytic murein transglycosylase D